MKKSIPANNLIVHWNDRAMCLAVCLLQKNATHVNITLTTVQDSASKTKWTYNRFPQTSDHVLCLEAYTEYMRIISSLENRRIRIYIDRGCHTESDHVPGGGAGVL